MPGVPESKSPTVYDVARQAEVSIATVSRVLRRPDKVAAATRERVMAAVQQLGYVPNASARGLAGRRTGVLGLLIPGHDLPTTTDREDARTATGEVAFIDDRDGSAADPYRNRYFEQLVRGAEAAAWREGYALMVAAGRDMGREVVMHDLAGRVDGLAAVSRTVPDELLRTSIGRTPLVLVAGHSTADGDGADGGSEGADGSEGDDGADGAVDGVGPRGAVGTTADAVRVDNRGGMRALVEHVLAVKPPGPVLYLAGPPDSPDAAGRAAGFRDAIGGGGAGSDGTGRGGTAWTELLGDFTWQGGHDAVAAHLEQDTPAAVIAANDQSALGALAALREGGVDVPGTCVVTGFDGIDESRWSTPALTTVRQPMLDLGVRAVELLLRRIADPGAPSTELLLPVDVLLRHSCGPHR